MSVTAKLARLDNLTSETISIVQQVAAKLGVDVADRPPEGTCYVRFQHTYREGAPTAPALLLELKQQDHHRLVALGGRVVIDPTSRQCVLAFYGFVLRREFSRPSSEHASAE